MPAKKGKKVAKKKATKKAKATYNERGHQTSGPFKHRSK